jgi:hypothetical protein
VLAGKSPAEVQELLGEPMITDSLGTDPLPKSANPHFGSGADTWYYDLGGEKYDWSLGPSGVVLAVDFQNRKVIGVRKVAH